MEKLADMISQVTNDLRLHERYALSSMKMAHGLNKSAFATCTRMMADALVMLYFDVLELLWTVCNLFSKRKNHRESKFLSHPW